VKLLDLNVNLQQTSQWSLYFKIAGKPLQVYPFFNWLFFGKFITDYILGIKKGVIDS